MSVLVTGSTGAFGPILVKWLQNHNSEQIWCTGKKSLKEKGYYSCDLTNAVETKSLIAKLRPQLIFHMAGNYVNTYELGVNITTAGVVNVSTIESTDINCFKVVLGSKAYFEKHPSQSTNS